MANRLSRLIIGGVGAVTVIVAPAAAQTHELQGIVVTNQNGRLTIKTPHGDQTISVFHINAATGLLSGVVGSPFASGLTLDSCAGISLAATPDGHFLMVIARARPECVTTAAP